MDHKRNDPTGNGGVFLCHKSYAFIRVAMNIMQILSVHALHKTHKSCPAFFSHLGRKAKKKIPNAKAFGIFVFQPIKTHGMAQSVEHVIGNDECHIRSLRSLPRVCSANFAVRF